MTREQFYKRLENIRLPKYLEEYTNKNMPILTYGVCSELRKFDRDAMGYLTIPRIINIVRISPRGLLEFDINVPDSRKLWWFVQGDYQYKNAVSIGSNRILFITDLENYAEVHSSLWATSNPIDCGLTEGDRVVLLNLAKAYAETLDGTVSNP